MDKKLKNKTKKNNKTKTIFVAKSPDVTSI